MGEDRLFGFKRAVCKKKGKDVAQDKVVLLHGLGRTHRSMKGLEKYLTDQGFEVYNIGYPSTRYPVERLAEDLREKLRGCCRGKGGRIHFVTHSLGGILLRCYMNRYPLEHPGRVVMLSPPNQGSEVVDRLKNTFLFRIVMGPAGGQLGTDPKSLPNRLGPVGFELGVIAGTGSRFALFSSLIPGENDGKVAVERARVEGMKDFLTVPRGHTFIMDAPEVSFQVVHFLENGVFKHDPVKYYE